VVCTEQSTCERAVVRLADAVGPGTYRFAVAPSLGEHGRERLLGCLNDLSIDRVKSHVDSVQDVPRGATVG
jgi:hypothetical protein